jgi:hypothetical protein
LIPTTIEFGPAVLDVGLAETHLDERNLRALERAFAKVRDHVRPLRPGRISS